MSIGNKSVKENSLEQAEALAVTMLVAIRNLRANKEPSGNRTEIHYCLKQIQDLERYFK